MLSIARHIVFFMLAVLMAPEALAGLIVVPNGNATTEGNARLNTAPFNTISIYQQIFGGTQFGSSPLLISEIAFRPDASQASAFNSSLSNIQIGLSTTSIAVSSLGSTFASNRGSDSTTVFSGALGFSSANLPGSGTAKQFDLIITLDTPFFYDPTHGNLLMEIVNSSAASLGFFVDAQIDSSGQITRLVFQDGSTSGPTGTVQAGGIVTQFTASVVPEPATLALMSLGLAGMGLRRKVSA